VLARALRLDDDQQAYLYRLAGKTPVKSRRRRRAAGRSGDAAPASTSSPRHPRWCWGVAWTSLPGTWVRRPLYTDFARIRDAHRNYVRLLFTDPIMRDMHADWQNDAH